MHHQLLRLKKLYKDCHTQLKEYNYIHTQYEHAQVYIIHRKYTCCRNPYSLSPYKNSCVVASHVQFFLKVPQFLLLPVQVQASQLTGVVTVPSDSSLTTSATHNTNIPSWQCLCLSVVMVTVASLSVAEFVYVTGGIYWLWGYRAFLVKQLYGVYLINFKLVEISCIHPTLTR